MISTAWSDCTLMCHERGIERTAFSWRRPSALIFSWIGKGIWDIGLRISRTSTVSNIFASKLISPCTLCSYEIDCADIVDLRTDGGCAVQCIDPCDKACDWRAYVANGRDPPSWHIARRLISDGHAGVLVESFAPSATCKDQNLVLWKWSNRPPHSVNVFDPSGRLPRNQLSWSER
jgi:RES domain-containing protein